jgi:hypothetical protein
LVSNPVVKHFLTHIANELRFYLKWTDVLLVTSRHHVYRTRDLIHVISNIIADFYLNFISMHDDKNMILLVCPLL